MTLQQAQQELQNQLNGVYDEREAANIANWVLEHMTGKKRIDRLLDKDLVLAESQETLFQQISKELLAHRPVQYVLGEAWFAGMKFYVNESVLIPRPETEELVDWVVQTIQNSKVKIKNIADVGTGSGCIPISLKKKFLELTVSAMDISEDALIVAKRNAKMLGVEIDFNTLDFLNEALWEKLPLYDYIVSNPPYIKQSEEALMSKNVLEFEPSIALFVPDEDALLFYRKIAVFAKSHLSENGMIFLEINEALGKEVAELYENYGYTIELRKDLQGKDRMIKANLRI